MLQLTKAAGHLEPLVRFLERRAALIVAGFSCLYFAGTSGRASQKLLWHDELFTLYLARLPTLADVWAAIATPVDGTPPLFHALTRASVGIFGEGLVALRLPSILAFLLGCVCLYRFVRRRYGPLYGLVAFVLPIATNASLYAYEARAYGVVFGLAGVSLACWQSAADGDRRRLSLALLFLSLAAAIATHYYAVLLLGPLAVGEAIRFWSRRRADRAMWCVLVASLAPLIVLQPLIRAAPALVTGWFSYSSPRAIVETYEGVLLPLVIPAVVFLVLVGATIAVPRIPEDTEPSPPAHEWIAMIVLLATPLWAAAIASAIVGSFVARYTLFWVLGFSVLAAFTVAACSRYARAAGALAAVTLLLWAGAKQVSAARFLMREPPSPETLYSHLVAERNTPLPIAVTHGHIFLPLVEYAPADIRSRLVMIIPSPRIAARIGQSGDTPLIGLAKWMTLQVEDLDSFTARHRRFVLYGPPSWILSELRTAGAILTYEGEDDAGGTLAVSNPGPSSLYLVTFK